MKRFLLIYGLMALFLLASCGERMIVVEQQLDEEIVIYPDYKGVTIPSNIAPLNISLQNLDNAQLIIEGEKGEGFQVQLRKGYFDIPQQKWNQLLNDNKGQKIKLTICKFVDGKWSAFSGWVSLVPPHTPNFIRHCSTTMNDAISLSWSKFSGMTDYMVYMSTDARNWTLVKRTAGDRCTVETLNGSRLKPFYVYYYNTIQHLQLHFF